MKRLLLMTLVSCAALGSTVLAHPRDELVSTHFANESHDQSLRQAGEKAERSVVKTISSLCKGRSSWFEGSGILLRAKGKVYVLTSDHVLLHGNEGVCHKIYGPELGELDAEYVTSDWGKGLALLRVPSLDSNKKAAAIDYRAGSLSDGKPLSMNADRGAFGGYDKVVVGYPLSSYYPRVDTGSNDESAPYHHGNGDEILGRPYAFQPLAEIIHVGARVEFGMSGGPVFYKGKLAGILSFVGEKDYTGNPEGYAVSATTVEAWLRVQVLGEKGDAIAFQEPLSAQLDRTGAVCTDGLLFTPQRVSSGATVIRITHLDAGACGPGVVTFKARQFDDWKTALSAGDPSASVTAIGYRFRYQQRLGYELFPGFGVGSVGHLVRFIQDDHGTLELN